MNQVGIANYNKVMEEIKSLQDPSFASAGISESEISPEKKEELRVMKDRIEGVLDNPEIRGEVSADFVHTFQQLGLGESEARELCDWVTQKLSEPNRLDGIEKEVLQRFEQITVKTNGEDLNLVEILHRELKARAELIFAQLQPHLVGIEGRVVDYGAGDGQVTQALHNKLGLDIEGYDVRSYAAPQVTVPMGVFNGDHIDVPDKFYNAAVMTNVAHHSENNETILQELNRIVKKKLVIIETVPTGETSKEIEKDRERTFMNDYLYNRLFHNADVPVPGTFETPEKWIERFGKYGWKASHSENLGFDQSIIKDVHHLFVFER